MTFNNNSGAVLTLDRTVTSIKHIEHLEATGMAIDELAVAVKELNIGAKLHLPVLPEGARLFRAREIVERPLTQAQVSYPPAHLLTQYGRANTPGQSMFYSCYGTDAYSDRNNMIGCLWEARAQEGKLYAISEWQTMEPLPLYCFGYRSPAFLEKPSRANSARTKQAWIFGATPAEPMAAIQMWEAELFTRHVQPGDEHLYRLSAALTKYAFDFRSTGQGLEWEKVAGIIYPSVATRLSIDNVCLWPGVVDAALQLLGVRIVEVRNMRLYEADEGNGPLDAVGTAVVTFHESSECCTDEGEIRWPKFWIRRSILDRVSDY